jgi:beta-lactamase class A
MFLFLSVTGLYAEPELKGLEEKLGPAIIAYPGTVAVSVIDLESEASFHHNRDELYQAESTIKIPIMVTAYEQAVNRKLDLSTRITYHSSHKVSGSGVLQFFNDGAVLTLEDAVTLMISVSDNIATNMVLDHVSIEDVNTFMRELGLKNTTLCRKVKNRSKIFHPEIEARFGLGAATAGDMALIMKKIAAYEVCSPAVCDAMITLLSRQFYDDRIPKYISEEADLVAHKTGTGLYCQHDVGLVRDGDFGYAIAIMIKAEPGKYNRLGTTELIAEISRIVYDYYKHKKI